MSVFRRARIADCLAIVLCAFAPTASAAMPDAPDEAAYRRSLQLRDQWMYLTKGLAGPTTWVDAERYRYRRTVEGGFEFVVRRIGDPQAQPTFEQQKLAMALGKTLGEIIDARRLPFADFEYEEGTRAIRAWTDSGRVRCSLGEEYRCERIGDEMDKTRPRAWGVVRDLSLPADNTPRRSPDDKYEAYVAGASTYPTPYSPIPTRCRRCSSARTARRWPSASSSAVSNACD